VIHRLEMLHVPAAAVSEADDVPDEDLIRAEGVAVGAVLGCQDDPRALSSQSSQGAKPVQSR
jgi:hypothetical protein